MPETFDRRLAEHYGAMPERLRQACDYVIANKLDTASRSLRAVAEDSGLAPATFTRLARALGYDNYEELRESLRSQINHRVTTFARRADALQHEAPSDAAGFVARYRDASRANIEALAESLDTEQLDRAVAALHEARNVVLMGALGSTGIVEYAAYVGTFLRANWSLAGRMGASVGSALVDLDKRDALLLVTKPPFARSTIRAAEMARAQGVFTVVITDSFSCPALRIASAGFVVPSDSPHFYSSYVATLFLVETLLAMVAQRAGPVAADRIARIEARNRDLREVIDG